MKTFWRALLLVALALALWPEFVRYRAEWALAEANGRLASVLRGKTPLPVASAMADTAISEAYAVLRVMPEDPRAALCAAVALLLRQRGSDAIAVLTPAIAAGERPELTLNLGRARGIAGDASGADAAFLRAAWLSPTAVATLPTAMRQPLLDRVSALEADLRAGRLQQAPPL